ncbi:MAG: squalene synthase HpnC [Burkholderiaceae bacterium]
MTDATLAKHAWISSAAHYENFPVGSLLVPARLRPDFAAVYRFARYADDIADEGDAPADVRLAELARLRAALVENAEHPVVEPLRPVLERHALSTAPFVDLLQAFSWDAAGMAFPDRSALLRYCRHSADPVGRIVLRLFDADRVADLAASDAICTALQLINFVQDVAQDTTRGRCYLPADEMAAAGVDAAGLAAMVRRARAGPALRALLDRQLDEALALMDRGQGLASAALPWRLRLELRAVIAGGLAIGSRLRREDPLAARIKLGRRDAFRLLRAWLTPRAFLP